MFPASELRVSLDGPATLFGFGGAILFERMCFSVRLSRNCLAMLSDCGTETMTGSYRGRLPIESMGFLCRLL